MQVVRLEINNILFFYFMKIEDIQIKFNYLKSII